MGFIKYIVIITFVSNMVYAGSCPKPVISLDEGAQAPCRGYLFSPEKESEVRLLNDKYAIAQEELTIKDKQINILKESNKIFDSIVDKEQQKSELWRKAAEDASLRVIKLEDKRNTRDILAVLMGIGLTIGAAWAMGQASK